MRDTVVIMGSHPRGREQFDWERTDCDVWVFNEAMSQGWVKRADTVFQLHAEPIWRNPKNRNDNGHIQWLKSGATPPVYMQTRYDDVPQSLAYPLDDVCAKLLPNFTARDARVRYFTSSIAYALALAIYQEYPVIELRGVEMETDTEYRYQRDGVTLWLGIAVGRGLTVKAYTNIFDFPLYGYEGEANLDYQVFVDRMAELEPKCAELKARYDALRADANQKLIQFTDTGTGKEEFVQAMLLQVRTGFEFGRLDGARQENGRYKAKADVMREASGGTFLFSRQEFEQTLQRLIGERHTMEQSAATYSGSAQHVLGEMASAKNKLKRKRKLQNDFLPVVTDFIQASIRTGLLTGALEENKRYLQTLDTYIKAAGGSKSEAVLLANLGG